MKTLRLSLLIALASLAMNQSHAADAETPAELAAFRAEFVENFNRTALNTTPGDARMLRILVESSRAKRGIEVGTATGYGAIVMGLGFERTGGHLTTIDISPTMVVAARENLKRVKLDKTVTAVEGDALEVLPKLEGRYDFLFLDAAKSDYLKYFRAIEKRLVPGCVIVADNCIKSRAAMQDFLDLMEEDPNYQMVIIRASDEKNDGMAVIYKMK